ncbi:proline-rich protein 18 [Trichechus inunguis]
MPPPPPAPRAPAARAKKQRSPEKSPEKPEALLSGSWPSATSRRPAARRSTGPAAGRTPAPAAPRLQPRAPPARPLPPARCAPPGRARSCDSLAPGPARTGTAPGPGAGAMERFTLSLPPEAVLLIQRRHLERQLPRGPGPAPPTGPSAARRPPQPLPAGDLRAVLQVSLLNERHKYDDVEYEDEAEAADEGLVRKCTEWLRGVETAATRDRAGRLGTLPHLSTL